MARLSSEQSVLGAGTRLTGRVTGDGSLRLEGQVKGEVVVSGAAEIASGASVEGNVQAEAVDVAGSLIGDVSARGPIAIHAGALVRGELKGSEVSIEPGSRVSVRIDTELDLDLGAPRRR
jgi:cytoskeletal protein CcmA (bactofilin family)